MKTKRNISILLIIVLTLCGFAAKEPSKKYERRILRADRFFDNFIYPKAIEQYEKAITEAEEFDAYSHLQIANSYRLMNMPLSSETWYKKVADHEIMTDQDHMNYAQVLLGNGKDEEARLAVSRVKHSETLDLARLSNIEDARKFFRDSLAYFVENMAINSPDADFSPTYYEGGIAFVSNRKTKKLLQSTYAWDGTYFLDLYYSENTADGVTKPKPFSARLNTIFHEGPSVFYDNSNKIIFTRNNFNLGRTRTSLEGVNKLKLYYAERAGKNKKWSKAKQLPFNSDEYAVGHPALSKDGKTLYFSSDMPGTEGEADLYVSKWVNDKWSDPQNLGDKINTSADELFPYISSDNILYFASAGHPGIGGLDIYRVDLKEEELVVENMGYPINTKSDDFAMILEGDIGYFSSDRAGGKGGDDIYALSVFRYDLIVNLVDAETGEKLVGALEVIDQFDNNLITEVDNQSSTEFTTFRGRRYTINGTSLGYNGNTIDFSSDVVPANATSFEVNVPLIAPRKPSNVILVHNFGKKDQVLDDLNGVEEYQGSFEDLKKSYDENRVDIIKVTELDAIYYDFDKYNIREDADLNLKKLKMVLDEYPELRVNLAAHTDSRGSNKYNQKLSKKRVDAAKDWLVQLGVESNRISVDYYGEGQLINECANGEECNEDGHQLNRRTEIILVREE